MAKRARKKKPGRKPMRVKIKGNPQPLIEWMLGKRGSPSRAEPRR